VRALYYRADMRSEHAAVHHSCDTANSGDVKSVSGSVSWIYSRRNGTTGPR